MKRMTHLTKLVALAIATAAFAFTLLPTHADVTPGADFETDAGLDTDGDTEWEDLTVGNPTGFGLFLRDATRVSASTSTQLTHAYDFPGGAIGNNGGAVVALTGTSTQRSFQEAPGDWTNDESVTIEVWVKPDTIDPGAVFGGAAANGMIIFEDGGGRGLGIIIDDNAVELRRANTNAEIAYNLSTDPSSLLLGGATTEFVQIVGTYDIGAGLLELFINGQSTGPAVASTGDWSGGDAAAFGGKGDSNVGGVGGGDASCVSFDGQIALIRMYRDQILTPAEIQANFDALSGPDLTAPSVSALDPPDDTPDFFAGSNLSVTFDEDVQALAGNINLVDLDTGTGNTSISISDTTQVTFTGDTVIIDPVVNLLFNTNYAVQIDASAIGDIAATPNVFPGIIDTTTWNFTTDVEDTTAPLVLTYSPEIDNSTVLPPSDLVVTFDDDIMAGTGSVILRNLTGSIDTTIDVLDASQVSIAGSVLTINPTDNLAGGVDYTVLIDGGAIENLTGIAYAGLTAGTWNFSTISETTMIASSNWLGGAWDNGDPTLGLDAIIDSTVTATATNSVNPWSGTLTLREDARLIITAGSNPNPPNMAFDGATEFFLEDGSEIVDNFKTTTFPQDFNITGTAGMDCNNNSGNNHNRIFNGTVGGGAWYTDGRNHVGYTYNSANTFTSYEIRASEAQRFGVGFNAPGSAGLGDVTVTTTGEQSGVIILGAGDVFSTTCVLTLNGKGWNGSTGGFGPYAGGAHVGTSVRIRMDSFNATVQQLFIDGVEQPAGDYTGADADWISGTGVLTVLTGAADVTAPTVLSIEDNVAGGPIFDDATVTYTVTFSENIKESTIDIGDFSNTTTPAAIINSVTKITSDVYEVEVTPGGPGTLQLQIPVGAVIEDLFSNGLLTPVLDDTVITVKDIATQIGSISVDFQGTIASEQHPTYAGEARYYHVSVNPDNPGTGSYAATIVGTNDPAPTFVRPFLGPVVAYKFAGGVNNDITAVAQSGGDAGRIVFSTVDTTFDGFGQSQAKIWTTTDPGEDIQTTIADPFNAVDDVGSTGGWRSLGGAVGTIDISGLPSGSVHIYYGAFNDTPSVSVVMRDTDGIEPQIVLADAHSIADGGNGDQANRTEYYLAEIDFVTEGAYDVIEFEWLANGSDYAGNGRGIATVLTGPDVVGDYATWAALYPGADLADPDADLDGDGRTNDYERIFGLDPTTALSSDPIAVPFDDALGTFSFTRRDPSLTGLFSDIETSFDLEMWTGDGDATLVVGDFDASTMIETVNVFISSGLLTAPDLFVRVNQNDGSLLSENFEADNGGFTVATTAGDSWEYGTPASSSPGGDVTAGNGGSTGAWGTLLGDGGANPGQYADSTVTKLRSPVIDLSGLDAAELLFAEALDLEAGDTAVVNIIDDTTDAVIAAAIYTSADLSDTTADWAVANGGAAIAIPPAALGQPVRIEWSFTGFGGASNDYMGWYIDDVTVRKTLGAP